MTDPFTYEQLEERPLRECFERRGKVAVVLPRKRGTLLRLFLRTDRRLRDVDHRKPSGWAIMADFSAAAYLTVRIYLFHRKLYELLPLVALHEPEMEWKPEGRDALTVVFTGEPQPAPAGETAPNDKGL